MSDLFVRLVIASAVVGLASIAARALQRYFASGVLPARFDHRDAKIGTPGPMLVQFTTPWCHECKEILPLLQEASRVHDAALAVIDAKERPGIAAKYRIRSTPTILVVDRKGTVTSSWKSSPPLPELTRALELASAS